MKFLKFRVDTFGFLNTKEKVKTIRSIRIPRTFKNLEHYIGLTGFMRYLVPEYGIFIEPLQKKKTELLINGREKGKMDTRSKKRLFVIKASFNPTPEEFIAFRLIQDRLYARITLRYFDRHKVLYL